MVEKIDLEVIKLLNQFATNGLEPSITFLLDLDPAEGLRRVGNPQLSLALEIDDIPEAGRLEIERKPGVVDPQLALALEPLDMPRAGRLEVEGQRRFEGESLHFHERVRQGFLDLAWDNPRRWIVVDASKPEAAVSQEIWRHVLRRLEIN